MGKRYIFFDLDGTLTDPAEGITSAVAHSLKKFGIIVDNKKQLNKFIGPPLTDSFENYYGFNEEQSRKAVEYYREYYRDKGIFENYVYDGLEDMLKSLKESGKILVVATSKPHIFASRILEHFCIDKYFNFVSGSELDGRRVKKDEVIEYAISECHISDNSEIVMVGDREYDILGAKKYCITSVGVLYGYGDIDELKNAGADFIAENMNQLKQILLGL